MEKQDLGKHTLEIIDQIPPSERESALAIVSRRKTKEFYAETDPRTNRSRYETLLNASYEFLLANPKEITADKLKFFAEKDDSTSSEDPAKAVLELFVNLNEKPVEVVEVKSH